MNRDRDLNAEFCGIYNKLSPASQKIIREILLRTIEGEQIDEVGEEVFRREGLSHLLKTPRTETEITVNPC